ncbi:DUF3168 domain-containing protein [Wenxinia marina]|uniref:Gene transfer agent protein n=1 Tax=Wenxinia marina DSM 24838 TaxID=1123501 RepID=A0A0D0NNS0_9RHOB|nr:DUF3168 domain-containing protein [Wenxinia marina]KIQ69935.1 hypothetical protein Wenmar_01505 [Wenxinia marina DSM 24838]GGL62293.1 hypothetical protein GCM10011392_16080 [Wenxinia marina]
MTYALASVLQQALYARLTGDAALDALVGGAVYDAAPPGVPPSLYVLIGPEKVQGRSDKTAGGAEHDLSVSVVTDAAGFANAKAAAAAVCDALVDAPLALSRGHLVGLHFRRATAGRSGTERRIDLTFRARVEDDAAA